MKNLSKYIFLIGLVFGVLSNCRSINSYINDDLFDAANVGYTDTVIALLNKGADVNAKNIDSQTALIWAASEGHTQTVSVLINKGADVNAKDNGGWTALIWSAFKGHTEIIELLKKAGAK